jgi:hypothetical protein
LDLGGLMIVAFSVGLVYTFEFVGRPFILAVVVSFRYAEYVVWSSIAWHGLASLIFCRWFLLVVYLTMHEQLRHSAAKISIDTHIHIHTHIHTHTRASTLGRGQHSRENSAIDKSIFIIIIVIIISSIMVMELVPVQRAVHTTPDTGPAAHVAMAVAHGGGEAEGRLFRPPLHRLPHMPGHGLDMT